MCAFGVNANAQPADGINFGLEVNASTGYYSTDDEYAEYKGVNDDKGDMELSPYKLTKGAIMLVTGKKGNVSAFLMMGLGDNQAITAFAGPASNDTAIKGDYVGMTQYSMSWKHSSGFEFLIGKRNGPYNMSSNYNSAFNWDGMFRYASWDTFPFQLKFSYMGAYLALVDCPVNKPVDLDAAYETDNLFPKIALGYVYGGGPAPMTIGAHFQYKQYKIVEEGDADPQDLDGETVMAYRLSADFKMNKVAGMMDVLATVYYGINSNQLGYSVAGVTRATVSGAFVDGDEIKDTTTIGGSAGLAVWFNAHKLAFGLGYEQSEADVDDAETDDDMTIFANFWYAVEPNFYIVPSILYKDHMKDHADEEEGTETLVGIAWQLKV
ncbi:MAG: hypothetical protein JXN64_03790 [Spirochaetes bacterium]|nr:hypothetical protein [Spirochaetota bacterium]